MGICRKLVSLFTVLCVLVVVAPAARGQSYDGVEQQIHDAWEAVFPGEGALAVEVARCEGWNSTAEFDLAHISNTGDVGPFQINQIHGRRGGVIEGQWPGAVQDLAGNIRVALVLRGESGWGPWDKSRHCWGWALNGVGVAEVEVSGLVPSFTG